MPRTKQTRLVFPHTINMFNVVWEERYGNCIDTLAALKKLIIKPEFDLIPVRMPCDVVIAHEALATEGQEPPIKRQRLTEHIKVDSLEELREMESKHVDPSERVVFYQKVFSYLESIRQNPTFIRYLNEPGEQKLPPSWPPAVLRLDSKQPRQVPDNNDNDSINDRSDFQSSISHVRKLAPLYAAIGRWYHAFNCLALPLYKPESHFDSRDLYEPLMEMKSMSPLLATIFCDEEEEYARRLEEQERRQKEQEENEEKEEKEEEEDEGKEKEKEKEKEETDAGRGESAKEAFPWKPRTLKEITAAFVLREGIYLDKTSALQDVVQYIDEVKELLVTQWMIELSLKCAYGSLPRYDNEYGSTLGPMRWLKVAMFAAGLHEEWDRLYLEVDDELQSSLGEDEDMLSKPRSYYTDTPRMSWD